MVQALTAYWVCRRLASSQSLLLIFRLEIAIYHFGPNHQPCWRYFVGSQGLDQRIAYNLSTWRAKLVMLCHAEWFCNQSSSHSRFCSAYLPVIIDYCYNYRKIVIFNPNLTQNLAIEQKLPKIIHIGGVYSNLASHSDMVWLLQVLPPASCLRSVSAQTHQRSASKDVCPWSRSSQTVHPLHENRFHPGFELMSFWEYSLRFEGWASPPQSIPHFSLPVLGQGRAGDNGRPFHERDSFNA